MKVDVHVRGKQVAQLYREHGDYLLRYLPGATDGDFVSLAMPVREEPWRWPRDLHPFFRQNLPEGYPRRRYPLSRLQRTLFDARAREIECDAGGKNTHVF